MTLIQIRDYLKTILPYDNCHFSTSKLDATKGKTLCLFSRSAPPSNIAVGGRESTGHTPKYLSLYVRWGTNAVEAVNKAQALFEPLETLSFELDGLQCNLNTVFAEPVTLGTDDKGIYEFSIDFNLIHERSK